jgi:hypothetical protein
MGVYPFETRGGPAARRKEEKDIDKIEHEILNKDMRREKLNRAYAPEKSEFIKTNIERGVNFALTIKPNCQKNKSLDDMVELAKKFIYYMNDKLLGSRFNKWPERQLRGFYSIEGDHKTRHLHFAIVVPADLIVKFVDLLPPAPPNPSWPREQKKQRFEEIRKNFMMRLARRYYPTANVVGSDVNCNGGSAEMWINYCLKTINRVEDSERACSF